MASSSNSDSDDEKQELLKKLKELDEELASYEGVNKTDEERKKEIMELLHEYNKIKDSTQVILGALADIEGVTVKKLHQKYNLPLDS